MHCDNLLQQLIPLILHVLAQLLLLLLIMQLTRCIYFCAVLLLKLYWHVTDVDALSMNQLVDIVAIEFYADLVFDRVMAKFNAEFIDCNCHIPQEGRV